MNIPTIKDLFRERGIKALAYLKEEPTNATLKQHYDAGETLKVCIWVQYHPDDVSHSMWLIANQLLYKIANEDEALVTKTIMEFLS